MAGRSPGRDSSRRAEEAATWLARRGFNSDSAGGRPFSGALISYEGALKPACIRAAASSVGSDADAKTKCAAGYCLGQWFTTRSCRLEPRRAKHPRQLANRPSLRVQQLAMATNSAANAAFLPARDVCRTSEFPHGRFLRRRTWYPPWRKTVVAGKG